MVSYLRAKRLLLVLDNFEQVTEAAPVVAELLAAAPGLVILVTSRTVLRLSGEYELCGAAAPGSAARDGREPRSSSYASVRLFVDRARRRGPGLRADQRATPRPSPRSAAGWTACRWPSSWPPPGSGCCPRGRCWPGSTTG